MTLGEYLRNKRIENGKSLEQVAALTKIHIKTLKAIEENAYSELPARTFTRGFIVNYAKALKLDTEQLLKEHHDFLETRFSERIQRDSGHQGYAFEGKELEQNRRWMMIGASIAMIFAVAVLLVFKPQNHKRKEKNKEFEQEIAVAENGGDDSQLAVAPPTSPTRDKHGNAAPSGTPTADLAPQGLGDRSTHSLPPFIGGENRSTLTHDPLSLEVHAHSVAQATPKPITEPSSQAVPVATIAAIAPALSVPPVAPSAAPSAAPTAAPTSTHVATTATPSASATPIASSTPAVDPLNKGDGLTATEVKKKIVLQAKEDVWIRYKSDDRPASILILRKGRFLVIKAHDSIFFESNHPESIAYKAKGGAFTDVGHEKNEIEGTGSIKEYGGGPLGTAVIPEEIPPPRAQ